MQSLLLCWLMINQAQTGPKRGLLLLLHLSRPQQARQLKNSILATACTALYTVLRVSGLQVK